MYNPEELLYTVLYATVREIKPLLHIRVLLLRTVILIMTIVPPLGILILYPPRLAIKGSLGAGAGMTRK